MLPEHLIAWAVSGLLSGLAGFFIYQWLITKRSW